MRLNMLTWLHSDIYRVDEVLARTFNMVRSFEQLCYLRDAILMTVLLAFRQYS